MREISINRGKTGEVEAEVTGTKRETAARSGAEAALTLRDGAGADTKAGK